MSQRSKSRPFYAKISHCLLLTVVVLFGKTYGQQSLHYFTAQPQTDCAYKDGELKILSSIRFEDPVEGDLPLWLAYHL